jgi:Cu2+-exporting ATPase
MTADIASADLSARTARRESSDEPLVASRKLGGDRYETQLSVPDVHCAGCIRRVETALSALPGVTAARVNLSTKRASVTWQGEATPPISATLEKMGYPGHLIDAAPEAKDKRLSRLILATGVAGFAALNIMMLSVAVWAGADGSTRDLLHWISALIAFPALLYAGRPFYESAWSAVRHGHTNMDVPIVIGVSLAFALSLYETITHGHQAFFDASVTLLFFLLIGRTLDYVMRERARTAVAGLIRLSPRGATVLDDDARSRFLPIAEVVPGMTVMVAAGERVPVDGVVITGTTEIDYALITGESVPRHVGAGAEVHGGTINLSSPFSIRATARADSSFLAEMIRLMEAAEGGRARYRRLADRVSRYYAPVVHIGALLTLMGWVLATGDWHQAISVAIAVLIITCPCALGLAVPIVQVVSARRLFDEGILVKDGSGIERLAEIDTVVFDKTGTLTMGPLRLLNAGDLDPEALAVAAAIATHSLHPISQSIVAAGGPVRPIAFTSVDEIAGQGLEARTPDATYRLGRADWVLGSSGESGTILGKESRLVARFSFDSQLRTGAQATIDELESMGLAVRLLSGDDAEAVEATATSLGIAEWRAQVQPRDKITEVQSLAASGHKALMVGDGLNDAPALAAAHTSMTPANAVDVGRRAADFVFLKESLSAVTTAIDLARRADGLVRQNIAFAIAYNAVAVPIAVLGYVTPLIAAVAMSLSSIIVVGNALRLRGRRRAEEAGQQSPQHHPHAA